MSCFSLYALGVYIFVRVLGGFINGGVYNRNGKSTLKQALAVLIKMRFTFTGPGCNSFKAGLRYPELVRNLNSEVKA